MTVDAYVETRVLPQHREAVAMLRALVRDCAPQAREVISYGMPVFVARDIIFAWIIGTKNDVTFGFREGIAIDDRYGVLKGVGKHARHIKLKSVDTVDRDVLRYYINEALALDAR
jgi:uncharacterized protein YdhG (YjbR/CyaY superfamily)